MGLVYSDHDSRLSYVPKSDCLSATGSAVSSGVNEGRGKSLKAFLRSTEKEYVEQVLEHMQGDKSKAAKALKISLAIPYRELPDKGNESKPDSPFSQI